MKKLTVWPKTGLGKFSFVVMISFVFSLLLRILHLEMGGFNTSLDGLLEIVFFFMEYAAGALAIVTGLISILAKKERSIIVVVYSAVPLIFILLLLFSSLL